MAKKSSTRKNVPRPDSSQKDATKGKRTSEKTAAKDQPSRTRRKTRPRTVETPQAFKAGFPVVGIGASAGGLEALEELFDAMPADTGMAFVVVTHQHPSQTSLLAELLGRKTEMPVVQVSEPTAVEPNHVYTVQPGYHLAILGGVLQPMQVRSLMRTVPVSGSRAIAPVGQPIMHTGSTQCMQAFATMMLSCFGP